MVQARGGSGRAGVVRHIRYRSAGHEQQRAGANVTGVDEVHRAVVCLSR
ncbi:MAG: hypothetical protein QOE61_1524 [Micromonosporaceae bacterium]|nr:hypothetical protein [Micromonosporaceae bacterium]